MLIKKCKYKNVSGELYFIDYYKYTSSKEDGFLSLVFNKTFNKLLFILNDDVEIINERTINIKLSLNKNFKINQIKFFNLSEKLESCLQNDFSFKLLINKSILKGHKKCFKKSF